MATANENMLQEFKDEFSCCICLDLYNLEDKIPRLLKCSHSFCTKCLVDCLDNDIEGKFRCPLCDVPLKIRSQDVANLQINIYLTNVMEKIIRRSAIAQNGPSDKDQDKQGTCGKIKQDQQNERGRQCQTHNMDATNFCVTCDSLMCPACFTTMTANKHIGHEIALAKEVFDDKMQKLTQCKASLGEVRALMGSRDSEALMSLKEDVNSLKIEIKSTAKDLHTKIDQWETKSYSDLNNFLEKAERENTSKSMTDLNKILDEVNEAIVEENSNFHARRTLGTATSLIKVTENITDVLKTYQPSKPTPCLSGKTELLLRKIDVKSSKKNDDTGKIGEKVKELADALKHPKMIDQIHKETHSPASGKNGASDKHRGDPRSNDVKVTSIARPLGGDVKLHSIGDKAWQPDSKKDKSGLSEEELKTKELYKKVNGILNKLTPQKFRKFVDQMIADCVIDTEDRLVGVVDIVFQKAVNEPRFSVAYANFCKAFSQLKVPRKDNPKEFTLFRNILLNRCQKEFEKIKTTEVDKTRMQGEVNACTSEEKRADMKLLMEEKIENARRKSLGTVRFIGELFKLKMLTEKIMHDCILCLLKYDDKTDELECLCMLISVIGKDLDTTKNTQRMNAYFTSLQSKVDSSEKRLPSRIRFVIKDVIELRGNNWVPRRTESAP